MSTVNLHSSFDGLLLRMGLADVAVTHSKLHRENGISAANWTVCLREPIQVVHSIMHNVRQQLY